MERALSRGPSGRCAHRPRGAARHRADRRRVAGRELHDLDDLERGLAQPRRRAPARPAGRGDLRSRPPRFRRWLASLDVVPAIRCCATTPRTSAVGAPRFEGRWDPDPADRVRVERLTRAIVRKLLHEPTVRLRDGGVDRDGLDLAAAVHELFGLPPVTTPLAARHARLAARAGPGRARGRRPARGWGARSRSCRSRRPATATGGAPSPSSAAAASSRGSSRRRCWTAASTSPCTRPRTSPPRTIRAGARRRAAARRRARRLVRPGPRAGGGAAGRPRRHRLAAAHARAAALRPDLRREPVRGNVDTRLRKRVERGLDGVVLAACGLDRLGLTARSASACPSSFVPEAGQGVVALQAPRRGRPRAARWTTPTRRAS